MDDIIKDFGFATDSPKIIKVIGVGGGGGIFNVGKSKAQLFEKGTGTKVTF